MSAAFESDQNSVVRFEVLGCDSEAIGSGFAVSPTLVVTAAHVVADGQVIRMIQGRTATAGRVIGVDTSTDVALVRSDQPLSGRALQFSSAQPSIGDQVGAIGFPEGDPLSFNIGTVSGLDRKAVIDGIPRHGLIELDAATTHGSSGGPVIKADGSVVGLVDAGPDGEPGRRLAVSSSTAEPLVAQWRQRPHPQEPASCSSAVGPDGRPVAAAGQASRTEREALATLDVYFRAVNNGDFPTAYAQVVSPGPYRSFAEGLTSSQDSQFSIDQISTRHGRPVISLQFTSQQDPGRGPRSRPREECTHWAIQYGFSRRHGLWLIESSRGYLGRTNRPC